MVVGGLARLRPLQANTLDRLLIANRFGQSQGESINQSPCAPQLQHKETCIRIHNHRKSLKKLVRFERMLQNSMILKVYRLPQTHNLRLQRLATTTGPLTTTAVTPSSRTSARIGTSSLHRPSFPPQRKVLRTGSWSCHCGR